MSYKNSTTPRNLYHMEFTWIEIARFADKIALVDIAI